MKVMRLLSSLKHDESERGIFHLGRALVKRGHTSIIVSSADKEHELVKRLERDGNIYHQLSLEKKSWMALRQIWPLRQLIEKYQPDIIHLHSRTPAWILHWALKGAKLKHKPKLVSTMYGFYPLNNYSRALLNVDCTITVSDSVSEYLLQGIKEVKKPPRSIIRIYRGVDTRNFPYRYNPSVYWIHRTFAEYPELEHKKWLLFPTVIGQEYGQEWLIDILGNLSEDFPNLHIIIMDEDSRRDVVHEEFMQRVNALELRDKFTFIGTKRNDMREWLAAANLVLGLANQPESIGINVLQAIHLGTPVVGWNKAAFHEILKPLYPQGLVKEETAYALCKVIRNQLENVMRPPITDKFTMQQMIDETLAVYRKLDDLNQLEQKDALVEKRQKKRRRNSSDVYQS
ncbi:glycosyltransferase family 4 protein [Psychrobacter sanguinis]|uniref:glycosyltransferase family 4 protein n=1 Tax=Psychrobacter sanguinis TaxID=861445 RepID=UPI001919E04C|nr:glycosyltransferase family 4 protein [Psychrobacter sanguinis]MCC3307153.1 glycosyltransferase family 4 protein [Psychrobacter sanguinis]UEC24517.1 glycosyltransferase family 4 protein [Psychrobacter sanguinis]